MQVRIGSSPLQSSPFCFPLAIGDGSLGVIIKHPRNNRRADDFSVILKIGHIYH